MHRPEAHPGLNPAKRILFVSPNKFSDIPNTAMASIPFLAHEGPVTQLPPLGAATLAALTPADFALEIHDEDIHGPVEKRLHQSQYDIIAMWVVVTQIQRALDIFAYCCDNNIPGIRVLSGPAATVKGRSSYDSVDVIFLGEVEYTWPRFVADLATGTPQPLYRQMSKPDLSDSPIPRWDLLQTDLDRYLTWTVQTTRGCPNTCQFCDIVTHHGHRPRHKPVARVIEEIELLQSLGARSIFFADENFVGDKTYAKALLDAVQALNNGFPTPLQFTAHADLSLSEDLELLERMADSNFVSVLMGIESPNRSVLNDLDKYRRLKRDIKTAIETIHHYGIMVMGSFILGSDEDDPGCFDRLADFLKEANVADTQAHLLFAPPGSPIWYRAKAEGRLLEATRGNDRRGPEDVSEYNISNIVPRQMSRVEALEGLARYLDTVFHPLHYLARAEGMMQQVKRTPRVKKPRSRDFQGRGKLIGRMLAYYLFKAPRDHRRAFFGLLRATLRHAPFMLPRAIYLHFRFLGNHYRFQLIARLARERAALEREHPERVVLMDPTLPISKEMRDQSREVIRFAHQKLQHHVQGRENLFQTVVAAVSDYARTGGPEGGTFDEKQGRRLEAICKASLETTGPAPTHPEDAASGLRLPPDFVREALYEVDRVLRDHI